MARLGVRIPGTDLDIHAASFDVDERCIAVGVRILVETAMQALEHYGAAAQPGGSRLRAVPPTPVPGSTTRRQVATPATTASKRSPAMSSPKTLATRCSRRSASASASRTRSTTRFSAP
jgi:hypothetical protein